MTVRCVLWLRQPPASSLPPPPDSPSVAGDIQVGVRGVLGHVTLASAAFIFIRLLSCFGLGRLSSGLTANANQDLAGLDE